MNIVLGIFSNILFYKVVHEEGASSFPFTELIGDYWSEIDSNNRIIDTVLHACLACNKIIFLIDGIKPGITMDSRSVTCKELITLLSNPSIPKSKIEFRENNIIVSLNYVTDKLNLIEVFDCIN